jgi:hypothetical protein
MSVNFTVERAVFCFFWILWLGYAFALCKLGFGEDTDAWLMAQTAQKLSFGETYDPARSFGNPVYEFLLVLIQSKQNWFWSNFFNLFLASVFLWRLDKYFPFLSGFQLLIARLTLMVLPVFTEAASSSMEYVLVWLLFFEALQARKNGFNWLFWCFSFLIVFTRLEFFLFLIPFFYSKNEKPHFLFYALAAYLGFYLFWSFGQNPSPFSSLENGIQFYGGRIFFLFKQAGPLLPLYLFLLADNLSNRNALTEYQKSGIFALAFFVLFPFEWAYAFPALISGLVSWISIFGKPVQVAIPISTFLLSIIHFETNSFLSFPSNFRNRNEMIKTYTSAQVIDFKRPTLILEGATYLPTNTRNWDKLMNNRLFHKKSSNLFIGERLSEKEIDSLKLSGMAVHQKFSDIHSFKF